MPGRILAIGDVHGCDVALEALLAAVAPTREDTVVVLGDVVDRGPGVRRCIDLLIALRGTGFQAVGQAVSEPSDARPAEGRPVPRPRLVFLMGNHEEMMLNVATAGDWLNAWLGFGGIETLHSYGRPPRIANIPESHWEFLKSGRDLYETEREIFVHANLDPARPLDRQPGNVLRWDGVSGDEPPHPSGKRVVCGHRAMKSGLPAVFPGWVCIDTWCHGGGWLTCLDVTTDTVWQANQAGRVRGPMPLGHVATPLP